MQRKRKRKRVKLKPTDVRIISGGQTGVDRAALSAGYEYRRAGVEIGGCVPRGWRDEDQDNRPHAAAKSEVGIPDKYRPYMVEDGVRDYRVRTRRNVLDSDCTVIMYPDYALGGGTLYTMQRCVELRKPFLPFLVDMFGDGEFEAESLGIWLDFIATRKFNEGRDKIRGPYKFLGLTVNFAGPRESKRPGIFAFCRDIIGFWLDTLAERK